MLRTHWRRDIAIPYLKARNISFYLPTIHENLTIKDEKKKSGAYKLEEFEKSQSPNEDALMFSPRILDSSRVLLFVITNQTRSLAPMTLAAHYIGLSYNVVLCIQMLPDDCKFGSEKVSWNSFRDGSHIFLEDDLKSPKPRHFYLLIFKTGNFECPDLGSYPKNDFWNYAQNYPE